MDERPAVSMKETRNSRSVTAGRKKGWLPVEEMTVLTSVMTVNGRAIFWRNVGHANEARLITFIDTLVSTYLPQDKVFKKMSIVSLFFEEASKEWSICVGQRVKRKRKIRPTQLHSFSTDASYKNIKRHNQ